MSTLAERDEAVERIKSRIDRLRKNWRESRPRILVEVVDLMAVLEALDDAERAYAEERGLL